MRCVKNIHLSGLGPLASACKHALLLQTQHSQKGNSLHAYIYGSCRRIIKDAHLRDLRYLLSGSGQALGAPMVLGKAALEALASFLASSQGQAWQPARPS